MNCFSTFSGMRSMINRNSILYINKYAKSITLDFSGTNFTDLSATPSYAISAAGLNPRSADISNSFALLKYNNRPLVVSDFGSGSFTLYLKHAASISTPSTFNFLYPNVVKLSAPYTTINQDFTAQLYSFLSPGTIIPYSITGCVSSDLNNASLIGTFTAPYQEITYRVTAIPSTNLVFFNVSGGLSTSIPLVTSIEYGVTVINNSKYAINGVQLNQITFLPSYRYVFTQTDGNFGTYPIKFSRTPDGAAISASDSQWTLSVEGTTTTLILNSSFTGVLYYYSTTLPYMGYAPPSITVSRASSFQNQIGRDSTFEFTIFNNTSTPVSFSMSSTVPTGTYALTASQLYTGTSAGYSLLNQSVPIGTTIVYCKNTALIYQTVTCTVSNGAYQTAVLAGPPPTISVSTVSSAVSQIGRDSTFQFTILNNTSADVSFSMSSSVTTGPYALTASHIYTSTSIGYSLIDQSVPTGTTTVYCKNMTLIYQTITCTLISGASQTAVLAGPPPSLTVSPSTVLYNGNFNFNITNTTGPGDISYSLTSSPTLLVTDISLASGTPITNVAVASGLSRTISCWNKTPVAKTVTLSSSTYSASASLYGPPSLAVSTASTIVYGTSFTFTVNNTTTAAITYSLSSTPPLLYTDISLASAADLTDVPVAAGVTKVITCWNKTPSAKTVILSSAGLTSKSAVLAELPPYAYNGTFTYSANTGGYKVLTLTGSGTLTLSPTTTFNYYVIGGGGAGGYGNSNGGQDSHGGNGGNGGVVKTGNFSNNGSNSFTVVVGVGGATSVANGGLSSISGDPITTVTADGGIGGTGGLRVTMPDQLLQTGGAKGGMGSSAGAATAGANGTISFIPTGLNYGGAGGGGTRAGNIGGGGITGGGNGNFQVGLPAQNAGRPGTNFGGGGGGGAGSGGGNAGIGGIGYQGAVLLYWV